MNTATSTIAVVLSNGSNIAQIVSSFSIGILIYQVYLSIVDNRIRSTREASVLSMKQADIFARDVLPEVVKIEDKLKSKNVFLQKRKIFLVSEIKNTMKESPDYQQLIKAFTSDNELMTSAFNLGNKLEAWAMVFTNGVADETVVFTSLGVAFCGIVEKFNFIFMIPSKEINRRGAYEKYDGIHKLYKLWSDRIQYDSVQKKMNELELSLKNVNAENVIKPIGL